MVKADDLDNCNLDFRAESCHGKKQSHLDKAPYTLIMHFHRVHDRACARRYVYARPSERPSDNDGGGLIRNWPDSTI